MKGEGEVKLNMAIGKGEQALKSTNAEGQKVIQNQLQTLKDLWSSIMATSVSCQRYFFNCCLFWPIAVIIITI